MECPKCGRVVEPGAFICPGCEFILDTSFLGDDITDDERDKRVAKPAPPPASKRRLASGVDFGEDAIILGDGQGDYSDFSSRDAGMTREVTQARFYIGGSTAALLNEDAVPEIVPGIVEGSMRMTPFERHVLSFINGKRSIGRIKKKSGMEDSEFKTSVAMLGDKGIIRVRTTKKKKRPDASSMVSELGLSSRSESSKAAPAGLPSRVPLSTAQDGERTVVAAFDIPEAKPQAKSEPAPRSRLDEKAANAASAAEATVVRSAEAPRGSRLPGFASMRVQAEAPADDAALPPDDEAPGESVARGRRNVWGDAEPNNISNVFARANPAPRPPQSRPSLVDEPQRVASQGRAPRPETTGLLSAENLPPPDELLPPGDEEGGFFDVRTGQRAEKGRSTAPEEAAAALADDVEAQFGLKDPTGMGDLKPVASRGGAAVRDSVRSDHGDDDGADAEADGFDEGFDAPAHNARDSVDEDAERAHDGDDAAASGDDAADDGLAEPPPTGVISRAGQPAPSDELFDDVTADPPIGSALSDDPTGPLPTRAASASDDGERDDAGDERDDERDDEDDEEAFDVELNTAHLDRMSAQQTASLPDKAPPTNNASIPELPSDALLPLPSQVMKAPPLPSPTASPAPSISRPPPAPQPQPPAVARPAPPPSLPGQSLLQKGPSAPPSGQTGGAAGGQPGAIPPRPAAPTVLRGGLPTARPSAGSKVPFEQARKAEKIFEQALKDHAEGRVSSARMNAKLAAMYDPTVEAYAEFLKALDVDGANAKPPGGGKPRELVLFEQASEAEGKGDFEKAVKLLEEAVALAPKAAALRNRLGVVLSIRLKRHSEAMEQLRIAIELEPGNIVYMNNFSKVTALLDSFLDRGPQDKKNRMKQGDGKVEIKKVRPKMF